MGMTWSGRRSLAGVVLCAALGVASPCGGFGRRRGHADPARRPDSDAPADRFRHYEMAGAAHATPDELNFAAAPADIT
jgi:hypothetical protein